MVEAKMLNILAAYKKKEEKDTWSSLFSVLVVSAKTENRPLTSALIPSVAPYLTRTKLTFLLFFFHGYVQ